MLLTYEHECKKYGTHMIGRERLRKVKFGLRAIKIVLGERRRQYKEATDETYVKERNDILKRRAAYRNNVRKARVGARKSRFFPQFIREKHPARKKLKWRDTKPRTNEIAQMNTVQSEQQPQATLVEQTSSNAL